MFVLIKKVGSCTDESPDNLRWVLREETSTGEIYFLSTLVLLEVLTGSSNVDPVRFNICVFVVSPFNGEDVVCFKVLFFCLSRALLTLPRSSFLPNLSWSHGGGNNPG